MTRIELERMADLDETMESLKLRKQMLFERRTDIAVHYSEAPGAHSYNDQLAEYVARISELEEEYSDLILEHGELYIRFARALEYLKLRERQVLKLKYEKRYGWKKVARTMYYSESRVKAIHKSALEKIRDF